MEQIRLCLAPPGAFGPEAGGQGEEGGVESTCV